MDINYKLSHNPHTYVNGYISMMRNMFLTSSIGLGAMAFSNRFRDYTIIVRIVAFSIFIYSCLYGVKSAIDFTQYIHYMESRKDIKEPYKSQIQQWKTWVWFTYIYIALLVIICFVIWTKKIWSGRQVEYFKKSKK